MGMVVSSVVSAGPQVLEDLDNPNVFTLHIYSCILDKLNKPKERNIIINFKLKRSNGMVPINAHLCVVP